MNVGVGADPAGDELKAAVISFVRALGHHVEDIGTHDEESADYPDVAEAAAESLSSGRSERVVLLCATGIGATISANKIRGVRAGLCHDAYTARRSVEHDDINVLIVATQVVGDAACELARAFLAAEFTGRQRHLRRLAKVRQLEEHGRARAQ